MNARVDICCGVGGTGKTTTSAALALAAARQGERVIVLTIDPARRLADALGLEGIDHEPREVSIGGPGTLHAMMLDRERTWDDLVRRHAPEATANQLFDNAYYRAVTTRLGGSHEYMAVEMLHRLAIDGDWDRVVVDTPPAQHVVDFFSAPERVRGLLDRGVIRALLQPGGGLRAAAARTTLSLVERIAGDGVMGDIRQFFSLVGELSLALRDRSADVATLLRSPTCRYWLVSDADAPERNDLLAFLGVLRNEGMTFAGFLLNRVQAMPRGPFPTQHALMAALSDRPLLVEALVDLPRLVEARALMHRQGARDLVRAAGGAPMWMLPEIAGGIGSVAGLQQLVPHLPPTQPVTL
jgi:anion-transporting  ArsA/GET3 family ATPase